MSLITDDEIARARARLALSEDEAALVQETLHITPPPPPTSPRWRSTGGWRRPSPA